MPNIENFIASLSEVDRHEFYKAIVTMNRLNFFVFSRGEISARLRNLSYALVDSRPTELSLKICELRGVERFIDALDIPLEDTRKES